MQPHLDEVGLASMSSARRMRIPRRGLSIVGEKEHGALIVRRVVRAAYFSRIEAVQRLASAMQQDQRLTVFILKMLVGHTAVFFVSPDFRALAALLAGSYSVCLALYIGADYIFLRDAIIPV